MRSGDTTLKNENVTFSPGLIPEDPQAIYWIKQVTYRLRREMCWYWYERGNMQIPGPGALPPFVDKASEDLSMSRYLKEKLSFFRNDETARYLTDLIDTKPPTINSPSPRGSFSWVIDTLNLDRTASFVLALGMTTAFDNAIGSIIASCLNDPSRTRPTLALAQKLWDEPEKVLMLADPAHTLFRYDLLQYHNHYATNHASWDWDSPISVPSLVANNLLYPDSQLPNALESIAVKDYPDKAFTDACKLVASRLDSLGNDSLRIVPVRGPTDSRHMDIVRAAASLTGRVIVSFKGDPNLLLCGSPVC